MTVMKMIIPESMMAVSLGENDGPLTSRRVPIPHAGKGEVLVKIAAAPINPSDLARIKNLTDEAEWRSFIPGVEGSGIVVACGTGLLPWLWLGKRVACSSSHNKSGTWAEYMVTPAMGCVPLPADVSDEQGAMMFVNPLTAVAFFEIIRHNRHQAVINTAAASSLGKIVEFLGKKHAVPVIQIVRNEKQKAYLKDRGAEYVLDSSVSSFTDELHALSIQLNASLVLDAVGGNLTRQLLMAVPYGSTLTIYGNLSGEQPEIDHRSLVTDNKKVSGFYLVNWLREQGMIITLRSIIQARKLLKSEISVPVQARFPLEKAQQAVETYLGNMTAGKVLLIP
jgi:NADPH2:quinone reductase